MAGASIPVQSIDNAYNTGYTVDVPIGWDSPVSPLGFRLDLGYTRLGSRDSFRTGHTTVVDGQPQTASLATNSAQIWSALVNAKLRLPFLGHFGGGPTSGLYAIGGVGVNHFRNYNTTFALTNPEFNDNGAVSSSRETLTRVARRGWRHLVGSRYCRSVPRVEICHGAHGEPPRELRADHTRRRIQGGRIVESEQGANVIVPVVTALATRVPRTRFDVSSRL